MLDELNRELYPQEMVDALEAVTPGQLTVFVPERSCYEKIRNQIMRVVMSMQIRVAVNVVPTEYGPFQWIGIVRRVSAFDPAKLSFAAVRLQDIDDTYEVGRFFRRKLFGVLDVPDELIEYYVPSRRSFMSKSSIAPGKISCSWSDVPSRPSFMSKSRNALRKIIGSWSVESAPGASSDECSFSHEPNHEKLIAYERDPEQQLEDKLEDERKQWIDALSALMVEYMMRFNEAPPMEMIRERIKGKFLLNSSRMSPITVSGDMKIFLPELNEIQLRMTPLATTVYILFLCHPEGIRLKDIADYRNELIEIYSMVKPGSDDRLGRRSIDDLVNPLGNSLQEKLSMTRRAIKRYILDQEMAEHYIIKGDRGGLYRINLDPEMINLPFILKS